MWLCNELHGLFAYALNADKATSFHDLEGQSPKKVKKYNLYKNKREFLLKVGMVKN